jgi:hypothetical protein
MMADESKRYSYQAITTLEHGLRVMLDLLTGYLGNNATRTEWLVEIQRRFTNRGKLRRGWSDDSIDRKIHKLQQMGLIIGGRGFGAYYSAVAPAEPRTEQTRPNSLLGFAGGADDTEPAFTREVPVNESLLDVLNAAKLQLSKPSAA